MEEGFLYLNIGIPILTAEQSLLPGFLPCFRPEMSSTLAYSHVAIRIKINIKISVTQSH